MESFVWATKECFNGDLETKSDTATSRVHFEAGLTWGDRESTLTLGIPTAKGQRCAIFINQMRDFDTKFSPWTGWIVQAVENRAQTWQGHVGRRCN